MQSNFGYLLNPDGTVNKIIGVDPENPTEGVVLEQIPTEMVKPRWKSGKWFDDFEGQAAKVEQQIKEEAKTKKKKNKRKPRGKVLEKERNLKKMQLKGMASELIEQILPKHSQLNTIRSNTQHPDFLKVDGIRKNCSRLELAIEKSKTLKQIRAFDIIKELQEGI